MNHICFNGKIIPAEEPVLLASNRGYRYGDGLFETMKLLKGKILLGAFHFERLFAGLSLLKFDLPRLFTPAKLEQEILLLSKKNNCEDLARVRLSVSRGNGGLYDDNKKLQWLVECWPLNALVNQLNENGLLIDVYPGVKKSTDVFANLKSANFLPYTMAALHAKEQRLNDCLVMNSTGRIADSTIANVFIIKNGCIITPALNEGCVNGVLRRWLLEQLRDSQPKPGKEDLLSSGLRQPVQETSLTIADIENADEVFLTNAIHGIRWVKQFGNKIYSNTQVLAIYERFISSIFT